jgi:hypothetical protein
LPPLALSLSSFPHSGPLFSVICRLFLQNTRGGGVPDTESARSLASPGSSLYVSVSLPAPARSGWQIPSLFCGGCSETVN